jgi:hypothetical protein
MRRDPTRRWPLAVLGLGLALALAACGGSPDGDRVASLSGGGGASGTTNGTAKTAKDPQQAALDFAKCMREHGIDYPDPQFQDGGVLQRMPEGAEDDPKFEEAQKACQPILDAVQPDGPSTEREGS